MNNNENIAKPNGETKKFEVFRKILAIIITFVSIFCIFCFWLIISQLPTLYAQEGDTKINISAEIRNLKSKDINKKLTAIERLAKSKDKKATLELLNEFKTQQNKHIKTKIVESLGNTDDTVVVPYLIEILKTEKDTIIKSLSVGSLASIGDDEATKILQETVLNENEEIVIRLEALEGLSRIRDKEIVFDTLVKATEDKNPLVRKTAAGLLWNKYYSEKKDLVTSILTKMLNDEAKEVAESVKQMLDFKPKE